MNKFEIVGVEFLTQVKKYNLPTKEDFVEFFMIYYEYSFCDDSIAHLFQTVGNAKETLLKSLQITCSNMQIDYEKQYQELSDDDLKRLWWSLQLFITSSLFKENKPIVVNKTIENLKNNLTHLPVKTLEIQMMFVNVLLAELPFSPRPLFNVGLNDCTFDKIKSEFMQLYDEHPEMFSLRKLKDNLVLPYALSSKFLSDAEMFFDIFVVSIFEAIPLDEENGAALLETMVQDYLYSNCKMKCVTNTIKNRINSFVLDFAHEATFAMMETDTQ